MELLKLKLIGTEKLQESELIKLKERVMIYLFDQGVNWTSIRWMKESVLRFESDVSPIDTLDYWSRKLNNYIELSGCYLIPENDKRKKIA